MIELLKIGKHNYVVGLDVWLSIETHNKAAKAAREKAKSLKFPFFAIRPSPVPQVGLLKNVQKGMLKGKVFSLAAAISGAQPESWSGLFALPSGKWWVLSIFNGVIISNGDLLADEETARAQFDKELARLPGDIQPVEISDPTEAMAWISKNISNKYPAVIRKTQDNSVVLAGGVVLGVTVVGGGFWIYHQHVIAEQRKAARIALLKQLAAEKKKEEKSSTQIAKVAPIVLPWAGKVSYSAWANAVKNIVLPLPLASHGWLLSEVTCSLRSCSVTWKRQPGVTVLEAPSKDIDANGNLSTTMYSLPTFASNLDVQAPVSGTSRRLQGWIQGLGINGGIQEQMNPGAYPLPTNAPKLNGVKSPPAPTWTAKSFSFSLPVPPWEISALELPGLVISSVTWNPGGNWHFTGVVYGPSH